MVVSGRFVTDAIIVLDDSSVVADEGEEEESFNF
jgi:hypothetical protein